MYSGVGWVMCVDVYSAAGCMCVVLHAISKMTKCCSVLQCVAVCCSVLQGVAVCCGVLQCVAVSRRLCAHVSLRVGVRDTRTGPHTHTLNTF